MQKYVIMKATLCNFYSPPSDPLFPSIRWIYINAYHSPSVYMPGRYIHTQNQMAMDKKAVHLDLLPKSMPGKQSTLEIHVLFRPVEVSEGQDVPSHRMDQACIHGYVHYSNKDESLW